MEKSLLNNILGRLGIESLTEMQTESAKAYKSGADTVILAPTGTGKTIAYLLPIIDDVDTRADYPQAIVIVPSRELAIQINSVLKQMKTEVRSCCCYGGRPAMDEHRTFMGIHPHVIIGTPGRLNDHLEKQNIDATNIKTVVLDEFDKCLEFGFQDEMKTVISKLPNIKQRMLLSATNREQIPNFVGTTNRVVINYLNTDENDQERVKVHVVNSYAKDKLDTLLDLLLSREQESSIVFLNYREAVERVFNFLHSKHLNCEMFHGGMEQDKREKAIYKFSNGTSNILVSTDLSARGLDIPDIDNIIHYHLPLNEEAYIHRNGRTARWEAKGNCYIIINDEETLPEYIGEKVDIYYIPKNLPEPKPSKWSTLYFGKGKKDKISKGDILGFLCKQGELGKEDIGKIDVRDYYSFAAVSRLKVKGLIEKIKGLKIKGQKTIIQEAK